MHFQALLCRFESLEFSTRCSFVLYGSKFTRVEKFLIKWTVHRQKVFHKDFGFFVTKLFWFDFWHFPHLLLNFLCVIKVAPFFAVFVGHFYIIYFTTWNYIPFDCFYVFQKEKLCLVLLFPYVTEIKFHLSQTYILFYKAKYSRNLPISILSTYISLSISLVKYVFCIFICFAQKKNYYIVIIPKGKKKEIGKGLGIILWKLSPTEILLVNFTLKWRLNSNLGNTQWTWSLKNLVFILFFPFIFLCNSFVQITIFLSFEIIFPNLIKKCLIVL